jgi:hypothetical protein
MVANSYFQFPLCALSFGQTENSRLNAILDYAVVEAGSSLFRKLTAEQQSDFIAAMCQEGKSPRGFRENVWSCCAALYGANVIGVTYGQLGSLVERHRKMKAHVAAFERLHGRDAKVRIKKGWLFDARDGHGITYREFCVLCAIYSAIGDKEFAIVTRDRIRRCALGYRTAAIMQAELAKRTDGAHLLTERQLRDTITRLHHNKFFARCTVARRITYYSIRLENDAMRKKVLERRTYAGFFHASQSAQDQVLTNAIKQRRHESYKSAVTAPTTSPLIKLPASRFPTPN